MATHDTQHRVDLDERWVSEWLIYGFSEMRLYLDKQARFSAYCAHRDALARRRLRYAERKAAA